MQNKKEMANGMAHLVLVEQTTRARVKAEEALGIAVLSNWTIQRPLLITTGRENITKFPALNARVQISDIPQVTDVITTTAKPYESTI